MWLKRLLKLNNTGPGGGSGGAGGDLGVGSDFSTGTLPGQGSFFDGPPDREELHNQKKRRKKKWRLLKDQPHNP